MGNHSRNRLLSSVEDRKDYHIILQRIATAAGKEAIMEAKVLKIPITYLNDNNQVVKNSRMEELKLSNSLVNPKPI
jgi:3-deoxy-D-arabino-heptulosonate 7-phosphate (DAHP) synthase